MTRGFELRCAPRSADSCMVEQKQSATRPDTRSVTTASQDAVLRVCNAGRRRDRDARAQRRFQRVLSKFALMLLSPAFPPGPLSSALCRSDYSKTKRFPCHVAVKL